MLPCTLAFHCTHNKTLNSFLFKGLQQTQPPATVREIWAARRRKAAMIDRDKAGLLGTLHLFSSSIHTSWSAETRFLSAEKPMIAATVPTIAPTAAIIVTLSGYLVPSAIPPKFCCKLNL
jgi:hypothetical protein